MDIHEYPHKECLGRWNLNEKGGDGSTCNLDVLQHMSEKQPLHKNCSSEECKNL